MSAGKKTLIIVLVVVLILGVAAYSFFAGNYNKFNAMDKSVKNTEAEIGNQLQRRLDLIPNLVETVKGYAKQEKDVLVEVTNARAKVGGAGNIPDKLAANNQLTGALSRLMVVVEKYPDLKSNQNFLKLQDALEGTENRLTVARKRYNDEVKVYNQTITSFPANLLAGMYGFKEAAFFKEEEAAKVVPKVKF